MRLQLLLMFLGFAPPFAASQCVDRLHYYYKCSQLAKYCKYPQAVRLRKSCPVTCGSCRATAPVLRLPPASIPTARPFSTSSAPSIATGFPRPPTPTRSPISTTPTPISPILISRALTRQPHRKVQPVAVLHNKTNGGRETGVVLADEQLDTCCRLRSISPNCHSLCTYSINKSEILAKAVSGSCRMEDAAVWVGCVAAGGRNSHCCHSRGVVGCDQLCDGQFPQNFNQLLHCVNEYLDIILACHRLNLSSDIR